MGQEQTNPYASRRTGYYTLGLLTVVYAFNFIDRQILGSDAWLSCCVAFSAPGRSA